VVVAAVIAAVVVVLVVVVEEVTVEEDEVDLEPAEAAEVSLYSNWLPKAVSQLGESMCFLKCL
jgi:hypothetical protein